ncbi:MAG: TraB/GumN family protein [Chitinophagales bacterium]|nr:TraB/GumN family protein [Chitinophagales bacterium]
MFCKSTIRISKLVAAAIIVMVASCKTAQQTEQSAKIELDPPISNDNTLLWQVSGNGLSEPSYLFGTIHVIASDDYFLKDNIVKKLYDAKQLVMEIDIKNSNTPLIAEKSVLPDDKTIKDYLSEEDYRKIESYFADSLGQPIALFKTAYARLKPFFLQQIIYLKYLGNNPSSYESEFMEKVMDKNVKILGLETLEDQIAIIDHLSIEEQYKNLIQAIQEGPEQKEYLDELIRVYKEMDINKLHEMIVDNEDFKDISNTFVDERNIKWIPKLQSFFKEGSTFVAVGAGHLGGEKGLIQLLRNVGYTVEPISIGDKDAD